MRRSRVVAVAAVSAVLLGVAYLTLPPTGSDLAAQVARADFFAAHGLAPVDLRWYGGVQQFGYSLLSQPVMALLGVRVTGALALVAAATAFAALLVRTGVPRPLLGSLVGVLTIAGNLVSGRVTYGLGVAFGLGALLALTLPRVPAPPTNTGPDAPTDASADGRARRRQFVRLGLAAAGALLASATSPVAGLFVGLAGAALLLTRRYADGLALGVAAALPLGLTALLFGDGGWMNISRTDTVRAVLTSLLVAALVGYRPVRVGALLSAAGVLAASLVHTPVGLNATRLAVMFALPLLAAAARPPARLTAWLDRAGASPANGSEGAGRTDVGPAGAAGSTRPAETARAGAAGGTRARGGVALAVLLAAVCWWQPPVSPADLRSVDDPTSRAAYFAPLRAFLDGQRITGRVEVPPTRNYWEAASLSGVPLARGWLRQADIDRNPIFFTTVPGAAGTGVPLTAASYRDWLTDNAVQFVAVPDAPLSWVGRAEAELVAGGLPYLTPVWSGPHWRVWAVTDPTPIVGAPAELVAQDGASVTFRAPAAGTVPVRVRHNRWLTASGGATVAADGGWTAVTVPRAGQYRLGS
ncbi:hypothetical protein [Micromonospora peucetia]|uniref:Dolichyl-phosphate-mannose-protein mannosyltransferase n=1 Tax=Micromonospora peucetia TaxID=47871 RepID=A0ABZ1EAQ5_9ACTN|nr:hypothetical protein [Micromonospora peucetia]WSA30695.1 hypothetical protein OIE14_21285 [Micromonospora peucetia]